MPVSTVHSITVDCHDQALGQFWEQVLGWTAAPDGSGWVTMADPEGNEFCVARSLAERG